MNAVSSQLAKGTSSPPTRTTCPKVTWALIGITTSMLKWKSLRDEMDDYPNDQEEHFEIHKLYIYTYMYIDILMVSSCHIEHM